MRNLFKISIVMNQKPRMRDSKLFKLVPMRYALIGAAFAISLFVTACGKKNDDIVGKWEGTLKLSAKDQESKTLVETAKKMRKSLIEFKKDNTFSLTQIEGTWTLKEGVVSLTTTKVNGQSVAKRKAQLAKMPGGAKYVSTVEKPMTMKLDSEGKTLTMESKSKTSTSSMVFTRQGNQ